MKISKISCLLMAMLLCVTMTVCPGATEATTAPGTTEETTNPNVTMEQASANASAGLDAVVPYLGSGMLVQNVGSAFLYEVNTGSLMYAWNPDAQVAPSSLVKIMTTLIAVEEGQLDDVVTVEEAVLATVPADAVAVDLLPGEQMLLSDLIHCMMVGSGNDAAAVIAHHVYGDQESFVQRMNAYAAELGCTATNFTNVHGLHDANQYTTVRDMAKIIAAAIQNKQFMQYFSQVRYLVPATNMSEARSLASSNFLMNNDSMEIYYDARVTGGRTGIANDGGRCIAATAEQNGLHMICIVTGAQSTFSEEGYTVTYGSFLEAISLFDAGFKGYKAVEVLYEGQSLKQLPVIGGASDLVIGSYTSVLSILPNDVQAADLSYQYRPYYEELRAPIEAGTMVSRVQIWYNNVCVAEADLYAMHSVSVMAQDTVVVHNGGGAKWPVVILLIIVIPVGLLVLMRFYNVIRRKLKSKKFKKARRSR